LTCGKVRFKANSYAFLKAPTALMQELGSKHHFPARLELDGKELNLKDDLNLKVFSVGLRKKLLFQVYAFGIYADEAGMGQFLSSAFAKASTGSKLEKNVVFYDSFINNGSFAKALSLVFLREITGEDMSEAFNVSIGERLQKMKQEEHTAGKKALQQFKDQFANRKLSKGATAAFIIEPGHVITTIIQKKRAGPSITSAPLCRALLDVYLGATPIDAKAKASLAANVLRFHKSSNSSKSGTQDGNEGSAKPKPNLRAKL